jgi:nitroreductase
MNVSEAVDSRRSVRAFTDRPVDSALLRELLELAARAPSGGNVQPWQIRVVVGEAMKNLKALVRERIAAAPRGEPMDYAIYPEPLWEPHRGERHEVGEQLYGLLGIAREDKTGRLRQFARNFEWFGAPVGLYCYVDRRMGPPQWSDLGMYLQTLMLLLRERGLDSCAQEAWAMYAPTVSGFLQTPPDWMLFCGMAIGYADPDAACNRLRSRRRPLEDFVSFVGA